MTYAHHTIASIATRLGGPFSLKLERGRWLCNGCPGATLDEAIEQALSFFVG